MESDDMFRSLVPDLTVEFDLEFNEQRQKEMAVNICLPGPGGTQHPITRQALSLDESEWFENGDINPRSCGKQWKVQKDEEEYDFEMKPLKKNLKTIRVLSEMRGKILYYNPKKLSIFIKMMSKCSQNAVKI